jgi:hypothetical protein
VLAANTPRFAGAVPPEAEALLEELTVFGTPARRAARLARWQRAGAGHAAGLHPAELSPAEIERTLSAFTPMLESRQSATAGGRHGTARQR